MFKWRFQRCLCWNQVKYARITITHVCFIALTLAGSLGRCLNARPKGLVFKQLPRDPANVNAWKKHVWSLYCIYRVATYYNFMIQLYFCLWKWGWFRNSVNLDKMPHSAAFYRRRHCTHLGVSSIQRVKMSSHSLSVKCHHMVLWV